VEDRRAAKADSASVVSLEEHMSAHLVCPISHCLMDEPVVAPSGHTYDRACIAAWLERRAVDPLSGAPLSPRALYPNRALQAELLEQLGRLAAVGDAALAAAAAVRLEAMRKATAGSCAGAGARSEAGRLERFSDCCCCVAAWCGEFAREQALVFTTSLGALACLALDLRAGWHPLGGTLAWQAAALAAGSEPRGVRRPVPLLLTFFKLAAWPNVAAPKHWQWFSQVTLTTLRCMLLLPVVPTFLALALGGAVSVARFALHFKGVRAVEMERAAHSRWWFRIRDAGSAVTGITSLVIFMRVYADERRRRG